MNGSNERILSSKIKELVNNTNVQMKKLIVIIENRVNEDEISYNEALSLSKVIPSCMDSYNEFSFSLSMLSGYLRYMIEYETYVNRWDGVSVLVTEWITSTEMCLSQVIKEVKSILRLDE